ncbi:MAG: tryptophan--tRNA ligase [Thermoprotei archaeon]|nr:tryptophan--tRNA ligase [Thermoproteales archaeon]RLE98060.1 MAG: tryptophan--tRNA ligase [Thermoprotei archaeon]
MMDREGIVLDPWGTSHVKDYRRLMEQFGIEPLEGELIERLPYKHRLVRRRIIFGHRDLEMILRAIEEGEEYAVMTGIKPSGEFHLGTKLTSEEFIYFLSLSPKARGFFAIADLEAYADNKIPLEESYRIALSNLMDMLALGLDPRRVYVYRQSQEMPVMQLAFIFSRSVTYNTLEAIYGPRPFGLYLSALVQAGDILNPQLPHHGGPKPTVVPVGADQDPHIRLTRDLARKYRGEFGFVPPAATYHKLLRDLTGQEKMSKRNPMGILYLTESLESARRKVMNAFTGGRATAEEQRRLGGEPEKCVIFVELLSTHFLEDDKQLEEWYWECKSGRMLCGECKARAWELIGAWLKRHQERRAKMRDLAERLLEEKTLS